MSTEIVKIYQTIIDKNVNTLENLIKDLSALKQLVDKLQDPSKTILYDSILEMNSEVISLARETKIAIIEYNKLKADLKVTKKKQVKSKQPD